MPILTPPPRQAEESSKRRARSRLDVSPGPEAFDAYDGFVRSLGFLSSAEASALVVAGDEILDNLLTHGEVGPAGITVLVRKRASGLTLAFFVDSHSKFASFSAFLDQGEHNGPRYDERERRWRGLGLTMCRNIADSICYRPGASVDRIILSFGL